ncbi:RDD family protein [Streptomyces sp. Da 82-17]|uniref:RDD family protein n=1 Tax=Streptomyces sp. Da 82-17 TaxID=3377116 RepID=UPI0038D5069A
MNHQQPPNQQHPYAQQYPNQPHPYAQQYPNQPHPYAQQPGLYQQQPGHPYVQQQPQQYQPQHRAPGVPEEVGDYRRWGAAFIDGSIAFVGGFALAKQLAEGESVGTFWGYVVGLVLGISFIHQVFGALIFRTTVGKFVCTTRVVRADDAGRPRFWQTVRRWLLGLTWLPMQPLAALTNDEGDPYDGDPCGLRYVRSQDLH